MKNKISKLQIALFVSQTIFLFLLPGLFTLSFNEIGKLYSSIIKGNFNFVTSLPYLTTMLVTIVITIIFGRFFCGWMCSFGFMNDILYTISSKIFKFKFKVDPKTDRILKSVKYVILIFILIFIWTLGISAINNLNPWNAFAQIANFKDAIFTYTLGFVVLALIAVGAMFIERFFCRYLCPLGAVFSIVSKLKLFKINKPNEKCGKCRLCTNKCSMGIELYKVNKVNSGECIACLKCLDVCPRKNTNLSAAGENINPALASSIAIATFAGVYAASTAASNIAIKNNGTAISSSVATGATKDHYKDGTYTGEGVGFRPGMQVSVTVKNGNISNIEITSNNDTPGYFDQASNVIPSEIIKAQSTSVDAVSGATRSSNGIMSAVEDALKNAKLSSTSSEPTTNSNSTASSQTEQNSDSSNTETQNSSSSNAAASNENSNTSSSNSSEKTYKDGTYTGVGNGFRPNLKVSVTVKNGKITNIEMLSNEETPRFFDAVSQTVPQEIISSQSTNVDAVSGATRSSNGIMEAVQNALENAK